MKRVLLDSDVILDVFFDRDPFSSFASSVLTMCERNEIQGFVTPVIISNVYYLLSRNSKHDYVLEKIKQLMSFLDVLIIDKSIILMALNSAFKDFEDALQHYSATETKSIDAILTRNVSDYKKSTIAVFTPEQFVKLSV